MAKLKFYTDEYISKAVVRGLKVRGITFSSKPKSIGDRIGILLLMHEVFSLEEMENLIEFI